MIISGIARSYRWTMNSMKLKMRLAVKSFAEFLAEFIKRLDFRI